MDDRGGLENRCGSYLPPWVRIPPPPPVGSGKSIGVNMKKIRAKLGMTQDDLVRKSGVKHTTLTKIEGDFVQKPSVQVIAKIARALTVSIEDLLN